MERLSVIETRKQEKSVSNFLWSIVAKIAALPPIANWLIRKAQQTPYAHLEGYMDRWWLFNRYSKIGSMELEPKRFDWLPSIRVHHILREDKGRHLHDHPWNARTIILKGWYDESRFEQWLCDDIHLVTEHLRKAGDTAKINYGEFHSIDQVSEGGVWTLFITYKYKGKWGFLVRDKKVPHDKYREVQA